MVKVVLHFKDYHDLVGVFHKINPTAEIWICKIKK